MITMAQANEIEKHERMLLKHRIATRKDFTAQVITQMNYRINAMMKLIRTEVLEIN